MRFAVLPTLLLLCTANCGAAMEDANAEVFRRSSCEFRFEIPDSLGGIRSGFVAAPDRPGEVGQKRSWQDPNTGESISVEWMAVAKEFLRAKTPAEIFAHLKNNRLADGRHKLVSERD